MFRRISTLACGLALASALVVAALHRHALGEFAGTQKSAACLYCSGGVVASSAPEVTPAVERMWTVEPPAAPAAPALRCRQALDHSGNAPPAPLEA